MSNRNVSNHSILGSLSDFYQQQTLQDSDKENDDELILSLPPIFKNKTNHNNSDNGPSSQIHQSLNNPSIPSIFSPMSKKNRFKSNRKDLIKGQKIEKTKENKKLQQLLKGDRIYATREERVLKRWENQQKKWQSMKKSIAQKVGKKTDELVITRAEEWREMVEEIDLMTKSLPASALSSHHWQHSLRKKTGNEETTHLVPIGNMFSGLYCKVTHNPKKPMNETVRKPRKLIDALSQESDIVPNHYNLPGKGAASKHWRKRSVTYQFRKKLHKKMTQLKPNNLDELDGLEIVGRNMFEIEELQMPSYSYERLIKYQDVKEKKKDTTSTEMNANDQEFDEKANEIVAAGPCIDLNPANIVFNAALYEEQTQVLQIENTGSTAMLLQFENVEQIFKDNAMFLYPTEQFSVLPGDTKRIAFYFKPSKPGSYHLVIGIHSFPQIQQKNIQLQGNCLIQDEDAIHRDAFINQIKDKRIEVDVANMVSNMIQSIPEHDPNMDDLPKSFCEINRDHELYWYPEILDELQTLSKTIISKFRRRKRNSYKWDLSVSTLKLWLNELEGIQPESVIQELHLTLSNCIERAQVIPPPNHLYYDLCSTLINDLALQMPRFSWKAARFAEVSYKSDMKPQEATNSDESDTSSTTELNIFESKCYQNKLYQYCNKYVHRIIDQFENCVINENEINDTLIQPIKCKLDLKPQRIITFGEWANNDTKSDSDDASETINSTEITSLYNNCIDCIHSNSKIAIMASSYNTWICSSKQPVNNENVDESNDDDDEKEVLSLCDSKLLPIFKGFNVIQVFCCENIINILTDTGDVYCSLLSDLKLYQTEILANKNIIKITGCPASNKCVALSESGEVFEWCLVSETEVITTNEKADKEKTETKESDTAETEPETEKKETLSVLRISNAKQWTEIDRKLIDIAITKTAYAGITEENDLILWGDLSAIYLANSDKVEDKKKKKKENSKSKKKDDTNEEKTESLPYSLIKEEANEIKYKDIVSCANSFIVLDDCGNLYSFGKDEHGFGFLGLGNEIAESLKPQVITFKTDIVIKAISSWEHGCCAMDNDATIYYWGKQFVSDNHSETKETSESTTDAPANIAFFKPTKIKIDVSCNEIKKIMLTSIGGFVWC